MLSLVSDEIEQYAIENSSPLPGNLEELVRVTRDDTDGFVMLSGAIEGMLLQFLVWATGARRVLVDRTL